MRARRLLLAFAFCLSACTAAPRPVAPEPIAAAAPAPPPSPAATLSPHLQDAELFGRWTIVAVNGRAPEGAGERTPYLAFGPSGYGGSSGCNSFGGYGLLEGGRYYASGASQTAIGCPGALAAQEEAILGILAASPTVARGGDGTLMLSAARGTIALRRQGSAEPAPDQGGPALLAGTRWTIAGIDGRRLAQEARRTLVLEAESWSLTGGCSPLGGRWRQRGGRIEARVPQILSRACPRDAAALDDALLALLAAGPRFVTGPNGEILIGGGGHWATGERPRAPLADEAHLLAGTWRIVSVDGAPPVPGSGAQLAFGRTFYAGSAGCNSLQGHFLAHGRIFFSAPPVRTEMACGGAVGAQEDRVAALLAGGPRIALAEGDEIALVDAAGAVRLRREAAAAPASAEGRLWAGEALAAELTMLDGTPLRMRIAEPETRLRLGPRRFDVETGCGRLGGVWRREEAGAIHLFTDAEPPPAGACAGPLATRLGDFMRLLNGRARILIGPSGELLVAGEAHMLAGRVAPAARRRR